MTWCLVWWFRTVPSHPKQWGESQRDSRFQHWMGGLIWSKVSTPPQTCGLKRVWTWIFSHDIPFKSSFDLFLWVTHGGFPKIRLPPVIHFRLGCSRVFSPSILGYAMTMETLVPGRSWMPQSPKSWTSSLLPCFETCPAQLWLNGTSAGMHGFLVGGFYFNPSEKNESQLGLLFPIYGKIKHVPNHQPALKL